MVEKTTWNREEYTNREFAAATEAREGLSMVVNPSASDCMHMVRYGLTSNCPVTPEDVTIANTMFGPNVASLKRKTTRRSSEPVVTEYVEIPQHILDLSKTVTLEADVIFVNILGFFTSTSRKIKFTTLEYIPRRTKGK